MARKNTLLTGKGIELINYICKSRGSKNNNDLVLGKKSYPLPYSDNSKGTSNWIARPVYKIGNASYTVYKNSQLAERLIAWFNHYGNMYGIDPNILAAQAYADSGFRVWNYKENTSGSGLFNTPMSTIYNVIVDNFTTVEPKMTSSEIQTIITGLEDDLSSGSYRPIGGSEVDVEVARRNRTILHQTVMNNVEIMIKAHARYMRFLSDNCNKVASSALFCYKMGTAYMANTYTKVIENYKEKNSVEYNDKAFKEGLDYVLKVFCVLGDVDNKIPRKFDKEFESDFKNIKGYSFGYSDLFTFNSTSDLQKYPNENFEPYNANVEESDVYGIDEKTLDNLTIARNDNYKFIYFPEDQYKKKEILDKTQVVLHHTVSGDDKEGVGNDIRWWKYKEEKVATAFIISRAGEIFQLFNTDYWAHHLGITADQISRLGTSQTNTFLNEHSIGIEIDSWGGLVKYGSEWYPPIYDARKDLPSFVPNKNAKPVDNVQLYNAENGYPKGFRGYFAFEKYTDAQINAVRDLILSLSIESTKYKGFPKILRNYTYTDEMWDVSKSALNGDAGVWTHVSYRYDKSDCHPQPELKSMLRNLKQ